MSPLNLTYQNMKTSSRIERGIPSYSESQGAWPRFETSFECDASSGMVSPCASHLSFGEPDQASCITFKFSNVRTHSSCQIFRVFSEDENYLSFWPPDSSVERRRCLLHEVEYQSI